MNKCLVGSVELNHINHATYTSDTSYTNYRLLKPSRVSVSATSRVQQPRCYKDWGQLPRMSKINLARKQWHQLGDFMGALVWIAMIPSLAILGTMAGY